MKENLEKLKTYWSKDHETLEKYGYTRQADVVRVCLETLTDAESGKGSDGGSAPDLNEQASLWRKECRVLETYGHDAASQALMVCARELTDALGDDAVTPNRSGVGGATDQSSSGSQASSPNGSSTEKEEEEAVAASFGKS